jgi:predicted dehydrogenase
MKTRIKRRDFLQSSASVTAAFSVLRPQTVFGSSANSAISLGLIGCGNRGTHVAKSFMSTTDARVVALADLFQVQLRKGAQTFNTLAVEKGFPKIANSHLFLGSDAYRRLLNLGDVDAVIVATPGYFHPEHLAAAIDAGKHAYCEKPAGIDVSGALQIQSTGRKAGKRCSLAIGFQLRHASPFVEMVKRVQEGAIGEIVNVQLYYFAGQIDYDWPSGVSRDEAIIRTNFWQRTISGGILLDQGIHVLDICNWVFDTHPLSAVGTGGRKGRTDQGDAWSHYQVLYEYPDDVNVEFHSTQFGEGLGDVCERFFGTAGIAEAHYTGGVFIKGQNPWDSGVARGTQEAVTRKQWAAGAFKSALEDADPNKQRAFIESIVSGNHINEAESGVRSTLTAILGRMAAERGRRITWEEMINSREVIDPKIDLTRFDRG